MLSRSVLTEIGVIIGRSVTVRQGSYADLVGAYTPMGAALGSADCGCLAVPAVKWARKRRINEHWRKACIGEQMLQVKTNKQGRQRKQRVHASLRIQLKRSLRLSVGFGVGGGDTCYIFIGGVKHLDNLAQEKRCLILCKRNGLLQSNQ
jgi:hypothetical protein